MFKYKWDGMQIAVGICFVVLTLCLLYFPYKIDTETQKIFFGYKAFLHWVLIVYCLRISLHLFGMEVYNLKGNIVAILVILAGSSYFKYLFGSKEGKEVIWSGVIIPDVMCLILIGILLVDRYLYTMETR